jgi:hypothetical protein
MPAALLHNNKKQNDLKDDRESSLHVLTWAASRFKKHTISEGNSNRFLRAFDETYEAGDGVRGDLKMGFFPTHEIPRNVKFDHLPHLDTNLPRHLRLALRSHRQLRIFRPSETRWQPRFQSPSCPTPIFASMLL